MIRRPLSTLERHYNESGTIGQMGIKIRDPQIVSDYLAKLKSSFIGLRLAATRTHICQRATDALTIPLPDGLSLKDACEFMYEEHYPDFSERLATVGANRDTIVLTCGHVCADGGYMLQVLQNLLSAEFRSSQFALPASVDELFDSQLKMHNTPVPHVLADPSITRVLPRRPVSEGSEPSRYVYLSCDASKLQCWDRVARRLHGLTEVLWTSSVLATSAFNDRLSQSGVSTCLDLRYLTDSSRLSWSLCNCYSNVNVSARIQPEQTLAELGAAMRADLKRKVGLGLQYSFLTALTSAVPGQPLLGIGLELSDLGLVPIDGPVTDCWFRSMTNDRTGEPLLSFTAYSVKDPDRTEWRTNVR
jgi:hypothetical protein